MTIILLLCGGVKMNKNTFLFCNIMGKNTLFLMSHLNGDAAEIEDGMAVDLSARAEDNRITAPDLQEVEEEIGRLKNNKAAGADQLPSELLKYGGEALARALHWVIAKIWEEERVPEEWMEGIVCPAYKKGDKLDCCNYRAITLLNACLLYTS